VGASVKGKSACIRVAEAGKARFLVNLGEAEGDFTQRGIPVEGLSHPGGGGR